MPTAEPQTRRREGFKRGRQSCKLEETGREEKERESKLEGTESTITVARVFHSSRADACHSAITAGRSYRPEERFVLGIDLVL